MQKSQKIIIAFLIVIVFFAVVWVLLKDTKPGMVGKNNPPIVIAQVLGDKDNFISFSPTPRSVVSGKVEATGVVKGGYFSEGNIIVKVVDAQGVELKTTNGTATTEWMTEGPVTFKVSLDFTTLKKGPSYIMLVQDDPSGGESGKAPKKILIPVIIK